MPPTFAYIMAFSLWLVLACLVWLTAGFMLLGHATRPLARPLSLAMAATFPAVILFQVAASPVVAAILLSVRMFWKTLEPGPSATTNSPLVGIVSIAGAMLAFVIMLGMSLAGFCEGWRIGWSYGKGRQLRAVMEQSAYGKLLRLLRRASR